MIDVADIRPRRHPLSYGCPPEKRRWMRFFVVYQQIRSYRWGVMRGFPTPPFWFATAIVIISGYRFVLIYKCCGNDVMCGCGFAVLGKCGFIIMRDKMMHRSGSVGYDSGFVDF
jgi:hypothetical protein